MPDNPAARLHIVARRLRFTKGPPARVWAHALDIHFNREMTGPPLVQVVRGILAFLDLVDETETGLRELKFDGFYAEAFPPLRRVAQRSLSNLCANQSHLTRPITDETLTLLRVIAAEWGKTKPDPKNLWARFYKISVKLFEIVRFASDTRKTIEAISPIVRLIGAPDEIPPVDLDGPNKQ